MVVAAEPPPAPLDHRVPDRRILVVDDVVDVGRSLARMLELAEYHVWVVHGVGGGGSPASTRRVSRHRDARDGRAGSGPTTAGTLRT